MPNELLTGLELVWKGLRSWLPGEIGQTYLEWEARRRRVKALNRPPTAAPVLPCDETVDRKRAAAKVSEFADVGVPLYVDSLGRVSFTRLAGRGDYPVLVCSIPKAGSYLFAALLEGMGLAPTHTHLHNDGTCFGDYRFATERQKRADYVELMHPLALERFVQLVPPGTFTVGHVFCLPNIQAVLWQQRFKILLVVRDLRAAVVSFLRYLLDTGRRVSPQDEVWVKLAAGPERTVAFLRGPGRALLQAAQLILPWATQPEVFPVSFEAMQGDRGEPARTALIEGIYRHLGIEALPGPITELVGRTLGKQTLTYSGQRSRLAGHWNEQVEEEFVRLGGPRLQEEFGYPALWQSEEKGSGVEIMSPRGSPR